MGDDAQRQSQSAQVTPHTAEMRELAARVAELEAEQRRQNRIAELLSAAGDPRVPPPRARRPRVPRDKRWLHVVRGAAVPLGAAGVFLRGHVRHAAAAAAGAVVLAGGTLAPDLVQPAPAAQVPRHHAVVRHHRVPAPVAVPVVPARRTRRRPDNDGAAAPRASVAPSPSVAPDPAPTEPDPVPSVTVPPPVPTPDPTCTLPLHGKHCHDDAVGDAVEALRDLPRLS